MDDLLKEMDDSNSETSIVDFNLASDDDEEEFNTDNIQPIQVISDLVEVTPLKEQVSSLQGQQDPQIKNNFENYAEENVTSLPVYHYRYKPKLIKRKQPRECNLLQGYQIIKTFGKQAHHSFKNVQQKKEQAIIKITNYFFNGVEKLRNL
ncbi:unnamed protein product (macronuclear) [Paramecium tetraurelia]|uniref:Uncharacterized protein n=1 Tax=Paramecium tetraurelia TaxID=5888 RepID=A0C911_PARTE|nr:uncharacterized protein GSPATT00006584001 [Paramecium tetraurelia]CAK67278.1 unnamed protein product [Paramecium tetraurelia]|eukprot:XP_001434675.1 hypothetical protein (macronuclear) [Paramecium tetraurelia strain d4-2]